MGLSNSFGVLPTKSRQLLKTFQFDFCDKSVISRIQKFAHPPVLKRHCAMVHDDDHVPVPPQTRQVASRGPWPALGGVPAGVQPVAWGGHPGPRGRGAPLVVRRRASPPRVEENRLPGAAGGALAGGHDGRQAPVRQHRLARGQETKWREGGQAQVQGEGELQLPGIQPVRVRGQRGAGDHLPFKSRGRARAVPPASPVELHHQGDCDQTDGPVEVVRVPPVRGSSGQ